MSKLSLAEAVYLAREAGVEVPLTANEPAHTLCASKQAQHDFFLAQGYPVPREFPDGSEPYIVRPDCAEGGRGIWVTDDYCEAGGAVNANFVTQEELTGPIFSVQLLGAEGRYAALPAVRLTMNDRYDRCAAEASADTDGALHALALGLAETLSLEGAVELKAVLHAGRFHILALNEGFAPLASTALYFAGLNAAAAYDALKKGEALPAVGQSSAVTLIRNGAAVGSREADLIGSLRADPEGLTDGVLVLKKV